MVFCIAGSADLSDFDNDPELVYDRRRFFTSFAGDLRSKALVTQDKSPQRGGVTKEGKHFFRPA